MRYNIRLKTQRGKFVFSIEILLINMVKFHRVWEKIVPVSELKTTDNGYFRLYKGHSIGLETHNGVSSK